MKLLDGTQLRTSGAAGILPDAAIGNDLTPGMHQRLNAPRDLTKRSMDIALAVLLVAFLAPLLVFLALAVKADGGPALFRHRRIGQNGTPFNCLKLRTMRPDAEQVLEELLACSPEAREEWAREFKLRNDPRITRLGQFLRKASLDELPQLINVIRGEMSLVGPRPIIASEVAVYGPAIRYYFMLRPGITGPWQISGRNLVSYDRRVLLDTEYCQRHSIWSDCIILIKTIGAVMSRRGAY